MRRSVPWVLIAALAIVAMLGAPLMPSFTATTAVLAQDDGDGRGRAGVDDRDLDGDGVLDLFDNCPETPNPDQADADGDGQGDACEPPPDSDGDGLPDGSDSCPSLPNADQADADGDGIGDACDAAGPLADSDGDGIWDRDDRCPALADPAQTDSDGDGVGDACEPTPTPVPPTPTPLPDPGRPGGRDAPPTPTPLPGEGGAPSQPEGEPPPAAEGEPLDWEPGPLPPMGPPPVLKPFVVPPATRASVVLIDSGSKGVTLPGGDGESKWLADRWQESGTAGGQVVTASTPVAIAGTSRDMLYQSERRSKRHKGAFGYQIPVPDPATYTVRVHFAELYWGVPGGGDGTIGARVFDVNAEGGPAELDDYDILAAAGAPRTAVVETFAVEVTDGVLDLRFRASAGQPTVSAIEVLGEPERIAVPAAGAGGLLAPGSGIGLVEVATLVHDSPGGKPIGRLPVGAAVILTGTGRGGFYYVNYGGGMGWVDPAALALPLGNPGFSLPEEEIIAIIYDAADRYSQPREDMLRVATCESQLVLGAVNPTGSYGLFQFVATTWASTPYADYNIFDPWASANAAGWMWSVGRRNEWVCQ